MVIEARLRGIGVDPGSLTLPSPSGLSSSHISVFRLPDPMKSKVGHILGSWKDLGMMQDAREWTRSIYGGCDLGDKRRTKRLVEPSMLLASEAGVSIGRACRLDSAAMHGAYRLFDNDAVDAGSIAEGGFASTAEQAGDVGSLLLIEDTTSLAFQHSIRDQLGDLGGPRGARARGWFVH